MGILARPVKYTDKHNTFNTGDFFFFDEQKNKIDPIYSIKKETYKEYVFDINDLNEFEGLKLVYSGNRVNNELPVSCTLSLGRLNKIEKLEKHINNIESSNFEKIRINCTPMVTTIDCSIKDGITINELQLFDSSYLKLIDGSIVDLELGDFVLTNSKDYRLRYNNIYFEFDKLYSMTFDDMEYVCDILPTT